MVGTALIAAVVCEERRKGVCACGCVCGSVTVRVWV